MHSRSPIFIFVLSQPQVTNLLELSNLFVEVGDVLLDDEGQLLDLHRLIVEDSLLPGVRKKGLVINILFICLSVIHPHLSDSLLDPFPDPVPPPPPWRHELRPRR